MLQATEKTNLPALLLIDDDLVSREVMATVLTLSGYTLHTAESGAAALALLDGGTCVPSAILVDAQMPGLSGTRLIAQLRMRSRARVVAISASKVPDELVAASDGFLLKPFAVGALREILERDEPRDEPQSPRATALTLPSASPSQADQNPVHDPAAPVVSAQVLAQLREMMPEAAVKQIYAAMVTDLDQRLAALEVAITNRDAAEIRRIGHAIKGGCGMAGALQAAHLGSLLQAGILDTAPASSARNHLDNSSSVLKDLRAATRRLERMLEAEFSA